MDARIETVDLGKLDKQGVASAKAQQHKAEANTKADRSVEHTLLRKEKLPLTPAELKRADKAKREVVSEDSAWKDRQKIAQIKRTALKYINYFGDKYPEIKKAPKPAESAGKDDWDDYMQTLCNVIGSQKAGERFDQYLGGLGKGIEYANVAFPDLFGGHNLVSPTPISAVLTSPEFLAAIDDEKHEIIFTYDSWFSSSKWSRLGTALAKAGVAVALQNAQAAKGEAPKAETVDRLAKMGRPKSRKDQP